MTLSPGDIDRTAVHDVERRGILIPADQLEGSGLAVGDRFTLKKGQRELFAVTLVKDPEGAIVFDRSGIFIARSRRVDILLGGIFDTYKVGIIASDPLKVVVQSTDPGLEAIR